jgi:pimeloyl-ACP methyl ester carboxylesterase
VTAIETEDGAATFVAHFERRARHFTTACGDGDLVWRAWGSGPPLMLAHGSHGAWSHWIRNIDALAAHRTVWAPDLPGFGDSAMPANPDHQAISDALALGLRDLIGAALPVDIIGFSFGGVASAYLAARYPDLVRKLILVGTGGLDTPLGTVDLRRVSGLRGEERREALTLNLLGLMLHDRDSVDDVARHLQVANGFRGRLDAASLVLPDKLLQALPFISAQVDAIWGEHDRPHPDPVVQEAALRRFIPEADFRVIAGAGHWAMYERPEAFTRVALELLQSPLRRP